MTVLRKAMPVVLTVLLSIAFIGCESTDDAPTSPGDNPGTGDTPGQSFEDLPDASEQDQQAAATKADDARVEMERVLSEGIYDADTIDLDMMDFAEADRLYQDAITADPKNTSAQFGAAVAHLLNLSVNTDVRAVQDSIDSFMEEDDFSGANKVARLPLIPAKMTLRALQDPMTVSDLQATVTADIIPAIDYALARLAIVEGDAEFSFVLTPEMMGDEDEAPIELDLGEAYLLDAQLRLLKSILLVMVAYDFDIDYQGNYEWLEESGEALLAHLERIDKTGTFLTLKSADSMRNAKAEILLAIGKMESALESTRAETDDQEDDLITREDIEDLDAEVDLSEEGDDTPMFFRDIRTIDDMLSKARETLESTVEIEADFDGDEDTPKSTLVFDIGKFFDAPLADLRALLPYHSWHLELLNNRSCTDELVVTDASGTPLGASPPVVFPDPSFGGILSNISSNQQLLDLLGIDAENVNEQDLLYEMGLMEYRDGGLIISNNGSDAVEVVYTGDIGSQYVEEHSVSVAAGAQEVDVVRSEFDRPVMGEYWFSYSVRRNDSIIYSDQLSMYGNIFVTVADGSITVETASYFAHHEDPANPYETVTIEIE